jgi:uncharacterized OsmC-like protein
MATPSKTAEVTAELTQRESYEFTCTFPGTSLPALELDESEPTGKGRGPNPVRMLSAAIGHCLSSTLYNSLVRAHVPSTPIRTRVAAEVGRNARGRLRVLALQVRIEAAPLQDSDRERFDRCVAIFEDYCTVTGAVREGMRISTEVAP